MQALPQELIRVKRDGGTLTDAQLQAFVHGLTSRSWSDAQCAAMAMAILLRGMSRDECAALTRSMTHSGSVIDRSRAGFGRPIVDKHSTGGVGDKVSLMLAPIVAACGAVVPMVSGRGLGHTGGTLDKLQSLAGYDVAPGRALFTRVLREAGCAIVGASARVAPADRRLYALRDVTATVESLPLITASILSKKLAAGLEGLVMDVKVGNGAFCATIEDARALATSLVEVAGAAGLPTRALVTDMNQVLGASAGNALEVREAIDFLTGHARGRTGDVAREPRLLEVTLALAAEMLVLCGLADSTGQGLRQATRALESGHAAERFERMVAGLGGPSDVLSPGFAGLHEAPVVIDVSAPSKGYIQRMDTRSLGLVVVSLGGGRAHAHAHVDRCVGLSHVAAVGRRVEVGEPLARVHAATLEHAEAARRRLLDAITLGSQAPPAAPLVHWHSSEVAPG